MSPAALAADVEAPTRIDKLVFEDGLLGFPQCRGFRLLATSHEGLYWLESTDCAPLAFLLADPFLFFDGYTIDLGALDIVHLRPADSTDIAIFITVTLHTAAQPTANLQGPIAINLANGRARQIIASNSRFGIREPIDLGFAL